MAKDSLKPVSKRRAKEIALHEAAHAVMLFLLGDVGKITSIKMKGKGGVAASVVMKVNLSPFSAAEVRRNLMVLMAGPAIDAWREGLRGEDWPYLYELMKHKMDDGADYLKAKVILRNFGERNPRRLFQQTAKWLDELFAEPRYLNLVRAVADALFAGKTMSAKRLQNILRREWGSDGYPIFTMNLKWQRRLMPELHQNRP